jgi:hypothetical protein
MNKADRRGSKLEDADHVIPVHTKGQKLVLVTGGRWGYVRESALAPRAGWHSHHITVEV